MERRERKNIAVLEKEKSTGREGEKAKSKYISKDDALNRNHYALPLSANI